MKDVLVIDLFAGPGGLGEGISSCTDESGHKPFKIGVSVERESSAHKTLTTRAFFRKIKDNEEARKDYYKYVRGSITRDELFSLHQEEAQSALHETLLKPRALGVDNELIHERIHKLVEKHKGPKIVIGGPPCQAYSLAGRSRNAGIKNYKAENDHRHFLYKEYLQVISIAQPEVFVMENVRGILSAKVDGKVMFPQILDDLRKPGLVTETADVLGYKIYSLVVGAENPKDPRYTNPSDFLIRSEFYGVPQARHRVILLGVRDDIDTIPTTLNKSSQYPISVESAIGDLPALRSGFSKKKDDVKDWESTITDNAIRLNRILKITNDKELVDKLNLAPLSNLSRKATIHSNFKSATIPSLLKKWLLDKDLNYVLNHETRGHMEDDLLRYAFCAAYALLNSGTSPKSRDFPNQLAPKHANWDSGKHADRFRVQSANKEATTVTSHISKDGHYFIHYDPRQCRSLTVREAARLQTFPDNYFFEGNRTQQYVQVGNAVPPFLAQQIGKVVMKLLSNN